MCFNDHTKMLRRPPFNLTISGFFFRVGLCSHTFLTCRRRAGITSSGSYREASIAWTRVHAIISQSTCTKSALSDDNRRLTLRHVASRGAPDLHQIKCISMWRYSSDGSSDSARMIMAHDRGSIVARSPRDRGEITRRFGPRLLSIDGSHDRTITSSFRP